jgi:hypothetical protein
MLKQSLEQMKETLTVQEGLIALLLERHANGVFATTVEELNDVLDRTVLLKGSNEQGTEVGIRIQYKPGHGPPSKLILPPGVGRVH